MMGTNGADMNAKVAVVAGAGTVGGAVAESLTAAGMAVAVLARDVNLANDVVNGLSHPGLSLPVEYDPGNEDSAKAAVAYVEKKLDRIDALVNTDLGIVRRACRDITVESFEKVMERNAFEYLLLARCCAAAMVRHGGGRIVNLSSVHGHVADGHHMEYAMATSAINALTRELAATYWKDRISAVTVTTCFVDGQFPDGSDMDQRQTPEQISLLGRRLTAADVARTVAFLVTAKTSCFNGAEIRADAGYLTTQYRVGEAPFAAPTA